MRSALSARTPSANRPEAIKYCEASLAGVASKCVCARVRVVMIAFLRRQNSYCGVIRRTPITMEWNAGKKKKEQNDARNRHVFGKF